MNKTQSCISREVLDQIGRDEILPSELQCIEDHVSECEHCRDLFAAVTAQPDWTDGILPILREQRDATPEIAEAELSCGHDSVLSLLGPTDDPRMLGRVGPYEVTGVIGRGGMGVVLKAFDASLNRFVAIKMMLPHLATSGAARKRFSREGQAAAAVIDDHVLPIYGVSEWQGVPYLVTQYSSGMSLQKRIQDQAPLELKEILRISLQTARGLAAAHAQGLVHRDVKPSNILLDGTVERALLTDFGLARAVDDASLTRSGTITGTPQFMAPEQARGESVDQRSDLFSLGAVIYAMCTGHPPFRAETSYGVLRRITDDEPRPIREINPEIPEWLCGIVARLMAKQPAERFASANEVAELLEKCLAHVQQPDRVPLPDQVLPRRTGKATWLTAPRMKRLAIAAAICVMALTGGFALVNNGWDNPSRSTVEGGGHVSPKSQSGGQPADSSEAIEPLPPSVNDIDRELAGLAESLHHDFARDGVPPDRIAVRSDDGSELTAAQSDGLHITHRGKAGYSNTFVETLKRVHGNFDVTASFQNLTIDPGENGSGGISLTAILENASHTHGTVHRGATVDHVEPIWNFIQCEVVHSPQRDPGVLWLGTTAEEATSGRLRLARVGETLYCLFAAGDSPEFRLIHAEQVGSEDLLYGGIRLITQVQSNDITRGTTSVIWKDLTIRAERITDWPAADSAEP